MSTMTATLSLYGRTDEQLAVGYTHGETVCFEELVRRYTDPIYAFTLRMVGRPEDAADLTQEVFVQLLKSLPGARTDAPLRPWIFVIARNKCLDHLKRRRALPFSDVAGEDDGGEITVADTAPLPEELVERADLAEILQHAIALLPERYRTVVALRYSSDLTFAEIGQVLGLPENTVKTHFQRAKALLRRNLAAVLGDA
jgi:RNA polymerase sigma factor (sigma-70 family)